MQVDTENLWSITDIADYKKVSKQAVCQWRARHKDFPISVVTIATRPVFLKDNVIAWLDNRGKK